MNFKAYSALLEYVFFISKNDKIVTNWYMWYSVSERCNVKMEWEMNCDVIK